MKPHAGRAEAGKLSTGRPSMKAASSADHFLTPRAFATAATCSSSLRDWASKLPAGRSATSRSPGGVRPRALARIQTSPSDVKCSISLVFKAPGRTIPKAMRRSAISSEGLNSTALARRMNPSGFTSTTARSTSERIGTLEGCDSFSNCQQLRESHAGRNLGCPRTFAIGLIRQGRTDEDQHASGRGWRLHACRRLHRHQHNPCRGTGACYNHEGRTAGSCRLNTAHRLSRRDVSRLDGSNPCDDDHGLSIGNRLRRSVWAGVPGPHRSSQTSSMRQPLKMLFTMMVMFFTSGRQQVPPRR
jgi:hypothetical protein